MKQFPEHMKFRYPWRTYQSKIIDQVKAFMEDRKLHIIAPPGSGKTVLGLKVAQLLNQRTLILSPSLAIRNQWRDLLVQDFLQGQAADWVSMDIHQPDFLTISTYQALHAAYKIDPQIIQGLVDSGIKTIVLDECHHLQKEWWKSLIQLVEAGGAQVVSLTATPPYDVSGAEWARYQKLCGEVDAEINVAELVKEKNLCPHQDYIYFSLPDEEESKNLYHFYGEIKDLTQLMYHDEGFIDLIKRHPYLQEPEKNLEAIYQKPAYFSALMIVLTGLGKVVPLSAIGIIGADDGALPKMDTHWLEVFLQGLLFHDAYFKAPGPKEAAKDIVRKIHQMGIIEQGKVYLQNPKRINKVLSSSKSKLESIKSIVDLEYKQLKDDLRMVVLCDFIRKESMPLHHLEEKEIKLLGVVPVFEYLRRRFPVKLEIGILTGTLVIIPLYSAEMFYDIVLEKGLSKTDFTLRPLRHDENYVELRCAAKLYNELIRMITELFSRGGIHILVGTKALLGEGWDAPAINTLVLATYVGSYVSSNQVRGRAIRTQKGNEQKTANIWHLVCVFPEFDHGGSDFQTLARRFKSFYGPGFEQNYTIENGLDRLHLPSPKQLAHAIQPINQKMKERASLREHLKQTWLKSIDQGQRMVAQIDVPKRYAPHRQKKARILFDKMKEIIPWRFNRSLQFSGIFLLFAVLIVAFVFYNYKAELATITYFFFRTFLVLAITFSPFILKRFKMIWQLQEQFKWLSKHLGKLLLAIAAMAIAIAGVFTWLGSLSGMLLLCTLGFIYIFHFTIPSGLFKIWKAYKKLEDTQAHLYKIALTVFLVLKELKLINPAIPNANLQVEQDEQGYSFYLKGVHPLDQATFLEAFQEVVQPIDNPRYLISKEIRYDKVIDLKMYYAVPKLMAKRKENALLFLKLWVKYVGKANLIFTRQQSGRLQLIQARAQGLLIGEPVKLYQSWK